MEFRGPIPVPRETPDVPDRLESWKDIANFLGREVRTVQNWEKTEGLPIHRHQHSRQGSVYAFRSELTAWRKARTIAADSAAAAQPPLELTPPSAPPAPSRRLAAWVAVVCAAALAAGLSIWKFRSSGEAVHSIVVLPFLDLSPAKDQEYFSDGLTEEIIDALSRVHDLRVVARTSAFAFKGTNKDVRQIGRELDVAAVLEGSVRKEADQLRITVQLNRASNGFHLWSRTYDRPLRDIFALQREISQSVADQLGAGTVVVRGSTTDVEAYRLFEEGRYFFYQFNPPESNNKAIEKYQQAIARDPKFALAYAGLADAYSYLAEMMTADPKVVSPKAEAATENAVQLDPMLGEAHTALGIVKLDYKWDRDGADRELRRAAELNPGSGYVRHWVGHSLEVQGREEDAVKEFQKALALDPLAVPIYWDLLNDLTDLQRYAETNALIARADELFPHNLTLLGSIVLAKYRMGDRGGGQKYAERIRARGASYSHNEFAAAALAYGAAKEGRPDEARRGLHHLEQIYRDKTFFAPIPALLMSTALGDRQATLTWLKRAYDDRSPFYPYYAIYFRNELAGVPGAAEFLASHR